MSEIQQSTFNGEALLRLRTAKGLTMRELAKRLGVTASAVSLWENGYYVPRWPIIVAMSRLFSVSLDTFKV